jgi:hypothetical protein
VLGDGVGLALSAITKVEGATRKDRP